MIEPSSNKIQMLVKTNDQGHETAWCKCWLTDAMAANMREVLGLEIDMIKGEKKPYGEHHTLYRFVLTDPFKIAVMEKLIGHANIHMDLQKRLN